MNIFRGKAIVDAPVGFYWWTDDALFETSALPPVWHVVNVHRWGNGKVILNWIGAEQWTNAGDTPDGEVFIGPLTPPNPAAEVDELQRLLLDILKHGVNGGRANLRHDVLEIRERLVKLKPDACLYANWGGPMPSEIEEGRKP